MGRHNYASAQLLALFLFLLVPSIAAVKSQDFKTCSQSGFCRRGRALSARAEAAGSAWKSPYSVDSSSISVVSHQATLTANVISSLYPDIQFALEVRIHADGVARVRMDEVDGLRKRYDEAASWALIEEPNVNKDITWKIGKKSARAAYGDGGVADAKDIGIVVTYQPLKVTLSRGGKEQVVLNGNGLLHMEHFRMKGVEDTASSESPQEGTDGDAQSVLEVNPAAWFEGDEEDAYWDENWSSWLDTKPKGGLIPSPYLHDH
jgi:mannosyl-oligosaccharide alpha-1,3-glucosidase